MASQPDERDGHGGPQGHSHPHHAAHGHTHGTHGHAPSFPGAEDESVKMMRTLAMFQRLDHYGSWMSNYRNKRIIPSSNRAVAIAAGAILLGGAGWLWLAAPWNLIGAGLALAGGLYLLVMAIIGLGLTMFLRHQRMSMRHAIVRSIPWRGDEQVLDVACGSGTLIIGMAQQLTSGKATGIDIYQPRSGGGTLKMLLDNARAEGVADRIEFKEMNARQMSFADGSFDVVGSSMALHHIGSNREEMKAAVIEMLRVLKPGGYLGLVDIAPMIEIAEATLKQAGVQMIGSGRARLYRYVTICKQ